MVQLAIGKEPVREDIMDLRDIVKISKAFSELGWVVQEQVLAILENGTDTDPSEFNTSAFPLIQGWIEKIMDADMDLFEEVQQLSYTLQILRDGQAPDCGDPGPDCIEHGGACD